jgi:hypothetical protein
VGGKLHYGKTFFFPGQTVPVAPRQEFYSRGGMDLQQGSVHLPSLLIEKYVQ